MLSSQRRVVITGLGIVSPIGTNVRSAWKNAIAGHSGIVRISKFDPSGFAVQIAGEIRDFDAKQYLSEKDTRRMDVFIQYGLVAGLEAIHDAGIEIKDQNAHRIGVAIGSGIGGLGLIESTNDIYDEGGPRKVSPFFIPGSIINMISGNLSILKGLKGPNLSIVTACATGVHSIGESARLIAYGSADVMVAGGAEAAITPLSLAGFCATHALSSRNDEPQRASRPWDKDRDGFVMGEGSGVLVLEEYEHAKRRGARIYAELLGYGMSGDAHHITAPSVDGPRRCMEYALQDAGISPNDVQYVNAHGTSTPLGDLNETLAIKALFGDHVYQLVLSSTKSMTGHLLGGAGGVESVFTVLSIYHQLIPPTINLLSPSPGCDLDYCPNEARQVSINIALKNNFGFGGTNGSLVFGRV